MTHNINQDGQQSEMPPRRAVVYLRPAHPDDQLIEHPAGLTIAQQGRYCHAAADRLEVEVVAEYVDRGGPDIEGRAVLRDMFELIAAEDIDYLIVFSPARLCERRDHFFALAEWLANCDTALVLTGATAAVEEAEVA
jgi:DNA invertase Pin-like site-specific DNA recombinase